MYTFADFVACFPPLSMPVTLGEDTHHTFSRENEPLPLALIEQWILPLEVDTYNNDIQPSESSDPTAPSTIHHLPSTVDEYTEYVPCFAIDADESYIALVWWKAELTNYTYTLATFTTKGELIQREIIGRTVWQDNVIHRTVATITEDFSIIIAEGASEANADMLAQDTLRVHHLDIHPNGAIR
jgi:hypothetical protein